MMLLRTAARKAVPWKNGNGTTREVVQFPEDANWENFHWRLSIATVAESGAFSSFPGVSRSLAILEGALRLTIDGSPRPIQYERSPPARFAGGAHTYGAVVHGPVTDLNLMVRDGLCTGSLCRFGTAMDPDERDWRIIILTGPTNLSGCDLRAMDAVLVAPSEAGPALPPGTDAWIARISAPLKK